MRRPTGTALEAGALGPRARSCVEVNRAAGRSWPWAEHLETMDALTRTRLAFPTHVSAQSSAGLGRGLLRVGGCAFGRPSFARSLQHHQLRFRICAPR